MKRFIVAIGMVMLLAAQASAITAGLGGYIYWARTASDSSATGKFTLKRLEIDKNYDNMTVKPVAFDCVTNINTYGSWPRVFRANNLEVFDPRATGGKGNLTLVSFVNNTPPSSGYANLASHQQPADILRINPTTHVQTVVCDGSLYNVPGATWDTFAISTALTAPPNYKPGTHDCGISLAAIQGIWAGKVKILYDTSGNGFIENATLASGVNTEGTSYAGTTPNDYEFGGDKALYVTTSSTATQVAIKRNKMMTNGSMLQEAFYTGPADRGPGLKFSLVVADGAGIAVDTRPSANPIVYFLALDNGFTNAAEKHLAIFALQNLNPGVDNIITGADTLTRIWYQGQNGVSSYSDSVYGGEDLELYLKPDGKRALMFNDYEGGLYALDLADNGLAIAGTGKMIFPAGNKGGPGGYGQGFELDMNPVPEVPEPATLLLMGTGALGALGWMRRRRMK